MENRNLLRITVAENYRRNGKIPQVGAIMTPDRLTPAEE